MITIIGICHDDQHDGENPPAYLERSRKRYLALLQEVQGNTGATLIGEETARDTMDTFARKVAIGQWPEWGIRQGGAATYDVLFDHNSNLVVTDSNDGVRILQWTGPEAPLRTGSGTPALKFDGYAKGPK